MERSISGDLMNLASEKVQKAMVALINKLNNDVYENIGLIYEDDEYTQLAILFADCLLLYRVAEEMINMKKSEVTEPDKTLEMIKSAEQKFTDFVKKYNKIENIYDKIQKTNFISLRKELEGTDFDSKIPNMDTLAEIKVSIDNSHKKIYELIEKLYTDRENAMNNLTSSVVRMYYHDPDGEDNKIREDVVKIRHYDSECTNIFNCALKDISEREEDFLKVFLNTYNSKANKPITKNEVHASILDDDKVQIWNNTTNVDTFKVARGGKKTRKLYRK